MALGSSSAFAERISTPDFDGDALSMPSPSDYVNTLWENGSPSANTDERFWGWKALAAGESLVPAGVKLRSRAKMVCNGYTGCGTGSSLARWALSIHTTTLEKAGSFGGDLKLVGSNGKSFPIFKVGHWAWSGKTMYVYPVASNDQYKTSMLSDFNKLFPTGTTFTVQQHCVGGFDKLGGSCGALPKQPYDGLAFETGFFDVNFDPQKFELRNFAQRDTHFAPRTAAETLAFHAAVRKIGPPKFPALNLTVALGGETYRCAGLNKYQTDTGSNFPVRVVKDGRLTSHVDMLQLRFEDKHGAANDAITGYFEMIVWPRCISFAASIAFKGSNGGDAAAAPAAADPSGKNCNRDFGGPSHPCLSAAFPLCTGFVSGVSWGKCFQKVVPTTSSPAFAPAFSAQLGVELEGTATNAKGLQEAGAPRPVSLAVRYCMDDKTGELAPVSAAAPVDAKNLVNFGGSGKANMLACEGDCDSDSDCAGSLKCFQRSNREAVPGCANNADVPASYDFCYDAADAPGGAAQIQVQELSSSGAVARFHGATFNATRNAWLAHLPAANHKSMPSKLESLDSYRLRLKNPSSKPQRVRLELFREPQRNVVGLSPMLLLPDGRPSGIPIQVSKNWHKLEYTRTVHDGTWLSLSTVLTLPAGFDSHLTLTIAFGNWGGVPSASHAQLSLIGWGSNGIWHEAALGSNGEQICFEPGRQQRRSAITDTRPMLTCGMDSTTTSCKKYGWTGNVGGGDFMLYYDAEGNYQYSKQSRATLRSPGPCLTNTTYEEVSANGALTHKATVALGRTDRYTKSYQMLSLRVQHDASVGRLALFQLGADGYNENEFQGCAFGNGSKIEAYMLGEWAKGEMAPAGKGYMGGGYDRRACGSSVSGGYARGSCWAFMPAMDIAPGARHGGADRGLVVREWKAVLGGKAVAQPHLSLYKSAEGKIVLEVSPPPGLTQLQAGDYVEAQLEIVVLPTSASMYYGPDKTLKDMLSAADAEAAKIGPAAKNLVNFGGSGKANMQTCEGDCDTDSDCAGSLKCFQRSSKREAVPGCAENPDVPASYDFCYASSTVPGCPAAEAGNIPDGGYCYDPNHAAAVVRELATLLTAGRLHGGSRALIEAEYARVAAARGDAAAVKHAMKLFVVTPEIRVTNLAPPTAKARTPPVPLASQGRGYKAVIVINMVGGADSFQMLQPHSGCEIRSQPGPNVSHDLHAELLAVRGADKMQGKDGLLPIAVAPGTQPCDTFGVHPRMKHVRSLYGAGDALWIANMGR